MPDRILRASILTSSSVDLLTADAERTCWRLLTIADDWGRLEADARVVLSRAFPLKIGDVSRAQVEGWLREIEEAGIIVRYEVGGKPFAAFSNWRRFNKLRNKLSKFPGPGGSFTDPDNDPGTCERLSATADERRQARGEESPRTAVDSRPQASPYPESESKSESENPIDQPVEIGGGGRPSGEPPGGAEEAPGESARAKFERLGRAGETMAEFARRYRAERLAAEGERPLPARVGIGVGLGVGGVGRG